jgi:hypothetical protein
VTATRPYSKVIAVIYTLSSSLFMRRWQRHR